MDAGRRAWSLPPAWAIFGLLGLCLMVGHVVAAPMPQSVQAAVSDPPLPMHERDLVYFPSAPAAVASDPLYDEIVILAGHPAVQARIAYFQTVIPDRVQKWLNRFDHYKPLIEPVFAEFGLPQELMYLSLVESGFNPVAVSRARAKGAWQFIRSTGRMYGLKVRELVDERQDPMKSTVAAAHHLRDLYDQFGSWPLAMAAYNAGAGKISRAIKKSGTRDFWKIAKSRRFIRRETRQYVPKFMALTMIAIDPTRFGFHVPANEMHQYEEVHFGKPVRLRDVAKETDISFQELRRLNPELVHGILPPDKDGYYLKVPVGKSRHVALAEPRLKKWMQAPRNKLWHRVRRGENLSVLAHRFGTDVRTLKRLNDLSGTVILVGQRLRVSEEASESGDGVRWYRVRRGDSLWGIAKRFRVSVRDLKALNNLRSNMIRTRQMLLLSP